MELKVEALILLGLLELFFTNHEQVSIMFSTLARAPQGYTTGAILPDIDKNANSIKVIDKNWFKTSQDTLYL